MGKPKVSIQPQLVLSKPKDSSPVVRFQTQAPRESMDQTKREHLPNPQNNQIIEKTSNYENWPEVLSLPQVSYCVQIVPAGP